MKSELVKAVLMLEQEINDCDLWEQLDERASGVLAKYLGIAVEEAKRQRLEE